MLCSRTLFLIHSVFNSFHLLISNSQCILLPPSPLGTTILFSISVSLFFFFIDKFICVMFLLAELLQSCPTLQTAAYQISLSMRILQSRILEWVAMHYSGNLPDPSSGSNLDGTHVSLCLLHWQEGSLPLVPSGKPQYFSFHT